jgi:uncharacterized protein with GYD domain
MPPTSIEEDDMEKYIYLTTWTDQGVKDSSNSIHRATAAMDTMETLGAHIYEVYWGTGPYDLVFMAQVPDHGTAHAVALAMARRGNIRTTAMRVFDRAEMLDIVGSVDDISLGRQAAPVTAPDGEAEEE